MSVALIGVSLPNFWLGIMLIYFLGGQLNLLPVAGRIEYGIEIKTITGLYLLDSLLTGNSGFLERVAALDAGVNTGLGTGGHRHPHFALQRTRSDAPGLRHDREGQRT